MTRMRDGATPKCAANARTTAAVARPSVGAVVVCTRKVPSASVVILFWRARGITRTLKI